MQKVFMKIFSGYETTLRKMPKEFFSALNI